MRYEIEWDTHGFVIRFFGPLTTSEILEVGSKFYNDKRFDSVKYGIRNFLEVTPVSSKEPEEELIDPLAMDLGAAKTLENYSLALIATSPETVKLCNEYIRLCKLYGLPWRVERFSTESEARKWIKTQLVNDHDCIPAINAGRKN